MKINVLLLILSCFFASNLSIDAQSRFAVGTWVIMGDDTKKNVDNFIKNIKISTIGEKTTLVIATLINDFEIIESSSCVDVANYNETLGAEICVERIKNKIWEFLGFLLQTAKEGIKK